MLSINLYVVCTTHFHSLHHPNCNLNNHNHLLTYLIFHIPLCIVNLSCIA